MTADPSTVDEESVKIRLADHDTPSLALALATAKAEQVSARHPATLVIGADQCLDSDGRRFDKPADMAAARDQLLALRGRTHHLHSAVAAVIDGRTVWRHVGDARLTMRDFSDAFLDAFLTGTGTDALGSVGAYRLEDRGIQLFSAIDGDYFTILGLPLLPLLDFLRQTGEIAR